MVGYSERGWLKWKMRRGKWPDFGLNPFSFHFSFINNPQTIHSTPNHILSTHLHPFYCHNTPFLLPTFVYAPSTVPGTCWRESIFALSSSSAVETKSEKGGERDEGMVDVKVVIVMSQSVSCLRDHQIPLLLSSRKVFVDVRAAP